MIGHKHEQQGPSPLEKSSFDSLQKAFGFGVEAPCAVQFKVADKRESRMSGSYVRVQRESASLLRTLQYPRSRHYLTAVPPVSSSGVRRRTSECCPLRTEADTAAVGPFPPAACKVTAGVASQAKRRAHSSVP